MSTTIVSAKAFSTDTPPDRIIGIECEYDLQNKDDQQKIIPLSSYLAENVLKKVGLQSDSSFLSNGGRLYIDVEHLEYDTAECLGPKQAAAADKAGILLMQKIIDASGLPHQGLYRNTGTTIQTRNGPLTQTTGTHENYLLPREVSDSNLMDRLLPSFLATRLYGMAGTVRKGFEFSQKVSGIGDTALIRTLERRTIHGHKPMAIIPTSQQDRDTIGSDEWARLEVRFADAPISSRGNFLKLAATSLILRLIEHPTLLNDDLLSYVELAKPVVAAKIFSADLTLTAVLQTTHQKSVSLINIQEAFLHAANELSQKIELPPDEVLALTLWADFCDALRKIKPDDVDYGELLKQYDFAARHWYLAAKNKPDGITQNSSKVLQQNLIWDRIWPIGGGLIFWNAQKDDLFEPEYINQFETKAPKTRAQIRSTAIQSGPHYVESWSTLRNTSDNQCTLLHDSYQSEL